MAMCLRCHTQTFLSLCDICYESEKAYTQAVSDGLAAGLTIDSGTIRNGERARLRCEERDRRVALEVE